MRADVESVDAVIRSLVAIQLTLAAVGLVVALRIADYVAGSVARPLRELVHSMERVREGQFDVQCPVATNDELLRLT